MPVTTTRRGSVICPNTGSLLLGGGADGDGNVLALEPTGEGEREGDRRFAGGARNPVRPLALRIELLEVQRRRDAALRDGEGGDGGIEDACAAGEVTGRRLDAAREQIAAPVEYGPDRTRLARVAGARPGPVRGDVVDLVRGRIRRAQRRGDRVGESVALGVRREKA